MSIEDVIEAGAKDIGIIVGPKRVIYSIAEWLIRKLMQDTGETVPNQHNLAKWRNASIDSEYTMLRSVDAESRIKAKKGTDIEAVALARKVLYIVHHLLTVQEMYQEEELLIVFIIKVLSVSYGFT